jgi:DNA-binding response OmpR family regulator
VVDDDPKIVRLVRTRLEREGARVVVAMDGLEALQLVETMNPDLLILDILLPGMDGCDVLRRIREFSSVPIMMLTAKNSEADKVRGLDSGADDYITKPFSERELVARAWAVLRRSEYTAEDRRPAVFATGDLKIDYGQHLVTVRGTEVRLTPTEYRLLALLAQNVGRTLLQEDILLKVWGPGYEGEAHLLRVNVARLRGKLGEDAMDPRYVLTRPGAGYLMPETRGDERL